MISLYFLEFLFYQIHLCFEVLILRKFEWNTCRIRFDSGEVLILCKLKIPKNTKISCVHFIFILPYGWYYENFQGHPLECWHVSCYVFMQWHVNKTHTLQTIAMKNMSLLILSCVVQIRFSLTQMRYKPYIV
jgi:hypothetical protein